MKYIVTSIDLRIRISFNIIIYYTIIITNNAHKYNYCLARYIVYAISMSNNFRSH